MLKHAVCPSTLFLEPQKFFTKYWGTAAEDNSRNALVSKVWSNKALSILWYRIESLRPGTVALSSDTLELLWQGLCLSSEITSRHSRDPLPLWTGRGFENIRRAYTRSRRTIGPYTIHLSSRKSRSVGPQWTYFRTCVW